MQVELVISFFYLLYGLTWCMFLLGIYLYLLHAFICHMLLCISYLYLLHALTCYMPLHVTTYMPLLASCLLLSHVFTCLMPCLMPYSSILCGIVWLLECSRSNALVESLLGYMCEVSSWILVAYHAMLVFLFPWLSHCWDICVMFVLGCLLGVFTGICLMERVARHNGIDNLW